MQSSILNVANYQFDAIRSSSQTLTAIPTIEIPVITKHSSESNFIATLSLGNLSIASTCPPGLAKSLLDESHPKEREVPMVIDDPAAEESTATETAEPSDANPIAIPIKAKTYVYPVTITLPRSQLVRDQPQIIDARNILRRSHGGVLPSEFSWTKYGRQKERIGMDGSESESSDGDDDQDDEGDGDDAADGEDSSTQLNNTPVVSKPRGRRRRDEWYDTDDSWIDDEDEFRGNVGLMKAIRTGFFLTFGDVEAVPIDGVSQMYGKSHLHLSFLFS
jgi:hypothetical protein